MQSKQTVCYRKNNTESRPSSGNRDESFDLVEEVAAAWADMDSTSAACTRNTGESRSNGWSLQNEAKLNYNRSEWQTADMNWENSGKHEKMYRYISASANTNNGNANANHCNLYGEWGTKANDAWSIACARGYGLSPE